MKNFNSTTEGTWIELVRVELTDEQKTLLMSKDPDDKDAQEQLVSKIKSDSQKSVSSEKSSKLSGLYNYFKPIIGDSDVYELISINVTEGDLFKGILNYRLNGEHKQVRF